MATKAKVTTKLPWQVKLVVVANGIMLGFSSVYVSLHPPKFIPPSELLTSSQVQILGLMLAVAFYFWQSYLLWKGKKLGLLLEGLVIIATIATGGILWGFIKSGLLLSTASRRYFGVLPREGVK